MMSCRERELPNALNVGDWNTASVVRADQDIDARIAQD